MFDIDLIKNRFRRYTTNSYLIDELTQLTIIRLSRYSNKGYNKKKFNKLVDIIIKCVYIDFYRRDKSEKIKTISLSELSHSELDNLIRSINKKPDINFDVLLSALDNITEVQRDVIFLRFYFGLKYTEIAELLDCSKNTALSHFHKAKLKLRKILTKGSLYE